MRVSGRMEPGSGMGPGTGHTGFGFAGRTGGGLFGAAVAVAESEFVLALSGRGARVVSCAPNGRAGAVRVRATSAVARLTREA